MHRLRSAIDHALAVSYRRNVYDGKAIFVGHITLVKGVPFFGYHVGYRYFLKIYMLNPLNMTRFADLLHQGAIMGEVLQPFESHLQYLLQWMCDFNLYGCSYIDCKTVKFRAPVPDDLDINSLKHEWHSKSISSEWISDPELYPRQSHCSLEVDIRVEDIQNRQDVETRDVHADFVERFGPMNPEEKLVRSLAGLWKDETKRRKRRMGLKDDSSSPFPPEVLVSMSADSRNTEKGGWIHEDEYRERVRDLVQTETQETLEKPSFESFVKPIPDGRSVKTALESVEDLFPHNLHQQATVDVDVLDPDGAAIRENQWGGLTLDEWDVPPFDDEEFPYDSDEEVAREIAMTQANSGAKPGMEQKMHPSRRPSPQKKSLKDPQEAEIDPLDARDVGDEQRCRDELSNTSAAIEYQDILQQEPTKRHLEDPGVDNCCDTSRSKRMKSAENDLASPSRDSGHKQPQDHASQGHSTIDQEPLPVVSMSASRQKLQNEHTPGSSQLSQGSIKARSPNVSSQKAFAVVKKPHGSQETRSKPSSGSSSTDTIKQKPKATPRTPRSKLKTTASYESPITPVDGPSSQVLQLASDVQTEFTSKPLLIIGQLPPGAQEVKNSLFELGLPDVIYQDAFYSNERDVPNIARDYAGREFKLESTTIPYLPDFDASGSSAAAFGEKQSIIPDASKEEYNYERRRRDCLLMNWEIADSPPSWDEVSFWLQEEEASEKPQPPTIFRKGQTRHGDSRLKTSNMSQIDGPTQMHEHGFKYSQKRKSTSVQHETQYMSIMSLEVHVNTRNHLVPNPDEDEVACIFWCIKLDDDAEVESNGSLEGTRVGILAISDNEDLAMNLSRTSGVEVETQETELDLINRIVDIVRQYDPDILTGYEVHNGSWGYLIERSRVKYDYDLCDEISRMMSQSHGRFGKEADRWGFNTTSTIRVTGRHMINVWRAMRSELNLLQYTLENVAFHLLHRRVPHYSFQDLTRWFQDGKGLAKCIHYFLTRVQLNLEILDANELVPRTSEQARLIGVDFFSVFSRGSQFKVESFMFRIAKPENFLLVSPSRKQVGQQNALECLPLVMEPQSAFYNSPLLVLDFQSLYPSIMIAYNYCYSTCLGRVVNWRGQNKMGFADFKREPRLLELVKDSINIAPNGMMYVKPSMRQSLLAKMLGEILETRFMVKSGMKQDKDDKTLQQLLNNRQLALKLLANVTYGYTSASFSGRMPCSEIADSIVQTGRETLEKAIALIHSVPAWGAEVVYGDTDSLFVYLRGRTRDQAFSIGQDIADTITKQNPRPIKLKFEKVYHPCVLLAKKRYVGFKYEHPSQKEPDFDAKGIETVRRDGTPAEQKIEEKALKILFRSADLTQVKRYFQRQCTKIMQGRVSIQDFCFAREVKLGTYADKGPPPPGALISTRKMLADPRTEPQYGERVPYVVVTGAPGARLIDRCVAPETLLKDDACAELDAEFYIAKNIIPPLERIFNLVGANVRLWYDEMPKVLRVRDVAPPQLPSSNAGNALGKTGNPGRKTMESYLHSSHCVVCRSKLPASTTHNPQTAPLPLCTSCLSDPSTSLYTLRSHLHAAERKAADVQKVCRSCAGLAWAEEVRCDSRDCPVFYSRVRERGRVERVGGVVSWVGGMLEGVGDDGLEW